MTAADLVVLAPWWITAAAALTAVLVAAFTSRRGVALGTTLGGLLAAGASIAWAARVAPREVPPLLVVDRFALLWTGLLLAAALAVALLAHGYLQRRRSTGRGERPGELYALLLLATLGALVLPASDHFASLFLGLETLSVALYALIGYFRDEPRGVEAALKYLILAAASSAFLLFGMALVYAETGSLELAGIAAASPGPLVLGGAALILVAVGFKLALVPFHLWTPDVYQGAPAPVTAFVATVSKGAVFALLLRWTMTLEGAFEDGAASGTLLVLLGTVAVASMLAGNLLALLQDDVKRLLAYSSIAHLGYALVPLLAGLAGRSRGASTLAVEGATFYLAAYGVTILGAFGVVAVLSAEREIGSLDDLRGLFWRRPALAALFTALLLSLAGIPLTAGFLAKLYALAAGVESALWLPVLVLVGTSAVGLFYYLRVVVALFSTPEGAPGQERAQPAAGTAAGATLTAVAVLLLWLGTWPEPVIRLIRAAVAGL